MRPDGGTRERAGTGIDPARQILLDRTWETALDQALPSRLRKTAFGRVRGMFLGWVWEMAFGRA
jgi:hypothetical protein